MSKTVIFIHGRNFKPEEEELKSLWYDAVRIGLDRDFGNKAVETFNEVNKHFVYYGDISNSYLSMKFNKAIPDNLNDRKNALKELSKYSKDDMYDEKIYDQFDGKSGLMEFLADTFSGLCNHLNIGDNLVALAAPDMEAYWNPESYYGSDIRARLLIPLMQALKSDEEILIVSHSLGTMISYDNLWKLSHYGEYRHEFGDSKKVDLWLTLGSPLGDEIVKSVLKGSRSKGKNRFPHNVKRWVNIAAEDDFISHDLKIEDDYNEMINEYNLIESVKDEEIYNLAVIGGQSNPHSSLGYLIHPKTSKLIHDWLKD